MYLLTDVFIEQALSATCLFLYVIHDSLCTLKLIQVPLLSRLSTMRLSIGGCEFSLPSSCWMVLFWFLLSSPFFTFFSFFHFSTFFPPFSYFFVLHMSSGSLSTTRLRIEMRILECRCVDIEVVWRLEGFSGISCWQGTQVYHSDPCSSTTISCCTRGAAIFLRAWSFLPVFTPRHSMLSPIHNS